MNDNTKPLIFLDSYPSLKSASYLMAVLIVAGILSYVDRQILTLVVQPVRADLGISDTQISLLHGFAFAIFYALLGLPLGRYADYANRRNLIAGGIVVWSAATVACGFADTFTELFLARIGVGIGEAALAPAAISMLCDSFRDKNRGAALGIYNTSIYLGIGLSIVLGGIVLGMIKNATHVHLPLIGDVRSWQAAFIIVGAPGVIIAALMLTVKEPTRHTVILDAPPISKTLAYVRRNRLAFFGQMFGFTMFTLASYGLSAWVPTYFIRIHHWTAAQAAVAYGLSVTFAGTLGVSLGGIIGDRWRNRGRADARLLLAVFAVMMFIPLILFGVSTNNAVLAMAAFGGSALFSSTAVGLGVTAVQDMVPDWMRGQSTAIFLFVMNLFGLGVGPTAIALVTDRVFANDLMLGRSIAIVTTPAILVGVGLVLLARASYCKLTIGLAATSRA